MKRKLSAALVVAAALALATPAHAYGASIDGNGFLAQIVAWFTGGDTEDPDRGFGIDPNG